MSLLSRSFVVSTAVAVFSAAPMFSQQGDAAFQKLRAYYFAGEFAQVLHEYPQLPAEARQYPASNFFVGQSYLRRHDFRSAEPFLRKAVSGNLTAQQRDATENALQRIDVLKRLCPPALTEFKDGGYTITIYAQPTPWAKSIAGQMPKFLQRAKEAFGNSTAHINFYLFDEREPYDRFFGSWNARGTEQEKHRGTGGVDLVMFCQYFPDGSKIGAKDVNDLYARVIHEYSHALCHTICGDFWGPKVPQWLNEGMADYFNRCYKPDAQNETFTKLANLGKTTSAPTYEQMSRGMYSLGFGYTVADAMVDQLLTGKDVSVFGEIIRAAQANGGNFEAALIQSTGKNPRAVLQQLVTTCWRR